MTLAEDQADLLRALLRHGVEFVIVGGVAAQLQGWAGATADLDIEVVRRADGVGRYDDWLLKAGEIEFEHLTISVAAPEDIVRSKEASGREKDRAVLPSMRRDFGFNE